MARTMFNEDPDGMPENEEEQKPMTWGQLYDKLYGPGGPYEGGGLAEAMNADFARLRELGE
ncbi:hypothetical protein PBI_MIMI_282 [Arthrobacter phage Mimi]|nr:hypothetical protein PBI_MIMI_76 [Arthrobacter phage Mimi]